MLTAPVPVAPLALTVKAQTKTTVTLAWVPPAGSEGYVFKVAGRLVSSTLDGSRSSVTFAASNCKTVGVCIVRSVAGQAEGSYPPPVTPPPSGNPVIGNCGGAHDPAWFNTASLPPGTIVDVCGTIQTPLSFPGSGITLRFQTGAGITVPACPGRGQGCIDTAGYSNDTILDGLIQNTANGTGMGHAASYGIEAANCTGCRIDGTTIANIYRRTSPSDETVDATQERAIDISGSGWTVNAVTIHDAGWAIVSETGVGATGDSITGSDISNVDHGWALGFLGPGARGTFRFVGNHVHDYANWDSTADSYHHDGVHCFTTTSQPAHFDNLDISSNVFDGDPGVNVTSDVFIEGGTGTPCGDTSSKTWLTGNTFTHPRAESNGYLGVFSTSPQILNNTFTGPGSGINVTTYNGQAAGALFENNLSVNASTLAALTLPATASHNAYLGTGTAWVCGTQFVTFTGWQACIGDQGANNTGTTVGLGANLTSSCSTVPELCISRPVTGPWNIGATPK